MLNLSPVRTDVISFIDLLSYICLEPVFLIWGSDQVFTLGSIYAWLLILRSSNSRIASSLEFDTLKTKILLKDALVMFAPYVLTEVRVLVSVDMKRMSSRGQTAEIRVIK